MATSRANAHSLLFASFAVIFLSVLTALLPSAEAKFSLSGVSTFTTERFSGPLQRVGPATPLLRKRGDPSAGHHPIIVPNPYNPCIPIKGLGHHPTGGHHGPDVGGHPCSGKHPTGGHHPPGSGHHPPIGGHHPPGDGHHPPGSGHHPPGSGHHPPGSGHHPVGGHHPPGHGHHCSGNASICLDPAKTPPGFTTCCHTKCSNLLTDPKHCGACLNVCHGGGTCCSGSCTDLLTNSSHCGSCSNVCQPGVACTFGICGYV